LITLLDIAALIPPDFRRQLLENNEIYKAVPENNDLNMQVLFVLYSNFIDPNNAMYAYKSTDGYIEIQTTCKICLNNIIAKFRELEPFLVQLEKEKQLYENI
jgi:hypothetical protein